MNWRLIGKAVLFFWVWFYTPNVDQLHAEDPKPVRIIRLEPRIGFAPAQFRLTIWVEPHEGNRELCLVWGQDLFEQSCRQLYGTESPRAFHYPASNSRELIYPGENFVAAVVKRNDEKLYWDKQTVEIKVRE